MGSHNRALAWKNSVRQHSCGKAARPITETRGTCSTALDNSPELLCTAESRAGCQSSAAQRGAPCVLNLLSVESAIHKPVVGARPPLHSPVRAAAPLHRQVRARNSSEAAAAEEECHSSSTGGRRVARRGGMVVWGSSSTANLLSCGESLNMLAGPKSALDSYAKA